jgi:hypothetical protein
MAGQMSFDDLHSQLRNALDQQFATLRDHYEHAIYEVRQLAEAEAERQAEVQTAAVRAEIEGRHLQLVEAARAEAEQRAREAAAAERETLDQALRQEFDRRLAEAVAAARADAEKQRKQLDLDFQQQLEHVVNSTRRSAELRREAEQRKAQEALDAERARAQAEVDALQQQHAALESERQQADAERDRVHAEGERIRQQLQNELTAERQQAAAERERMQQEIAAIRAQAASELEAERQRSAAAIEQQRADEQGGRAALAAVRAEFDGVKAEFERVKAEADQARNRDQAADAERARLTAEHAHATGELERVNAELARVSAELERVRQQTEADAAVTGQTGVQLEAARAAMVRLEAELEGATAELAAVRHQAQTDLDHERQQAQRVSDTAASELQRLRAEFAGHAEHARAEIHGIAPPLHDASPAVDVAPLVSAMRDLDDSRTLTQALDALVTHAGSLAGRAALFLISGDRLSAWKAAAMPADHIRDVDTPIAGPDLLARAVRTGHGLRTASDLPTPAFARASVDRDALAVPVMIGGRAVAVLYVDPGSDASDAASPAAFEMVDTLARHASSVLALRTAMRTLDVLRGVPIDVSGNGDDGGEGQGARRFARLLLSEIKLYNEGAVRVGRQQRDLLQRLGAEIARARRLYEERVPASLGARHAYFQQELVQTLADGDAALLGNP